MRNCIVTILATASLALVTLTSSSKILLIPVPHYSHINFFTVAAKTLKENGHEVVILVNEKHEKRVTKSNVSALVYPLSADADLPSMSADLIVELAESDTNIIYKGYYAYRKLMNGIDGFCTQVLGNSNIMQKIKDEKFDLAILDSFPLIGCLHYITYKFDIKFILLGPYTSSWKFGVPSIPFHEPPPMLEIKKAELGLKDKVVSMISTALLANMYSFLSFDQYCSMFVPEKPFKGASQLQGEAQMCLITIEINCFDFPKVSAPNYKFIGSLSGEVSVDPLPQEFKDFADNAKDGVIIISFGSMIGLRKTIVKPIRMLLEALGRMKEKAVLQFTLADLGDAQIPPNVLVKEWLPQTDLLAHPNTKLFIAHGGLNGHLEATYFGVPILTLPYQPEQARNGARAEAKGHGKLLKWEETDALELYQTMREIIDDESYRKSIQKCAAILKDLPSAREQLVFWVNHVIKYGAEHLRPVAANMPSYKFFGLDVIAAFLIAFVIVTLMTFYCCRCCFRRCCQRSQSKHKKE